MTDQEILNNGPEGWTHADSGGGYWRITDDGSTYEYSRKGSKWLWLNEPLYVGSIHSRAYIERIVELEEKAIGYVDLLAECATMLENFSKNIGSMGAKNQADKIRKFTEGQNV